MGRKDNLERLVIDFLRVTPEGYYAADLQEAIEVHTTITIDMRLLLAILMRLHHERRIGLEADGTTRRRWVALPAKAGEVLPTIFDESPDEAAPSDPG